MPTTGDSVLRHPSKLGLVYIYKKQSGKEEVKEGNQDSSLIERSEGHLLGIWHLRNIEGRPLSGSDEISFTVEELTELSKVLLLMVGSGAVGLEPVELRDAESLNGCKDFELGIREAEAVDGGDSGLAQSG